MDLCFGDRKVLRTAIEALIISVIIWALEGPVGLVVFVTLLRELFKFVWKLVWKLWKPNDEHKIVTSLKTLQRFHKDPGSYAALMYFHGYLTKILPDQESGQPCLRDRIDAFKSQHKMSHSRFPSTKLFILMPSSGASHPLIGKNLSERNKDMIRPRCSLEPLLLNRGGVIKRPFKNSVYQIMLDPSNQKRHVSIVVEYATPLITAYESYHKNSHSSPSIEIDKLFLKFFYQSFCCELQSLMSHSQEMKNLYELVMYDDEIINEYDALMQYLSDHEGLEDSVTEDSTNECNCVNCGPPVDIDSLPHGQSSYMF